MDRSCLQERFPPSPAYLHWVQAATKLWTENETLSPADQQRSPDFEREGGNG